MYEKQFLVISYLSMCFVLEIRAITITISKLWKKFSRQINYKTSQFDNFPSSCFKLNHLRVVTT